MFLVNRYLYSSHVSLISSKTLSVVFILKYKKINKELNSHQNLTRLYFSFTSRSCVPIAVKSTNRSEISLFIYAAYIKWVRLFNASADARISNRTPLITGIRKTVARTRIKIHVDRAEKSKIVDYIFKDI